MNKGNKEVERRRIDVEFDVSSCYMRPNAQDKFGAEERRKRMEGDPRFNSVIPSLWRFSVASGTKILERAWISVARGRA